MLRQKLTTTQRKCYICGTSNNPIIASESVEHRYGRPLMPEGVYKFARCRFCGTLYVDSNVTDAYLADIYAQETPTSVEVGGVSIDHDALLALRRAEFARHWSTMKRCCPPKAGTKLLDIGCQTGDFGALAQRDGIVPNGIELSAEYAEICRCRWGRPSRVHCGPATTAPFGPGQFRYITAFETFEHMLDPIAVLRHVRPWLANDGILALSVPSSDYFHFKFWLLRRSPLASLARAAFARRSAGYLQHAIPHTHIYNFSAASVRRLLRGADFSPIYVGLTGWHGSGAPVLRKAGEALRMITDSKLAFAPSLLAVARRAQI